MVNFMFCAFYHDGKKKRGKQRKKKKRETKEKKKKKGKEKKEGKEDSHMNTEDAQVPLGRLSLTSP